jgi:hypothetical protein
MRIDFIAMTIAALLAGSVAYAQSTRQEIVDPCLANRETCPQVRQVPATAPPPRQELVDPCLANRETCPQFRPVAPEVRLPTTPPVITTPPRRPPASVADERRITYGGPQTITCFQGGGVMFQHVGVTGVRATWTRHYVDLSFKLGGVRRKLLVNLNGATCLIERTGKETVAIYEQR